MTVYDQNLSGASDPTIVAICQSEERVLITSDLDLSNIRDYPPQENNGIVVLRHKRPGKKEVLRLLNLIIPHLAVEALKGRLWIVTENKIRVRGG